MDPEIDALLESVSVRLNTVVALMNRGEQPAMPATWLMRSAWVMSEGATIQLTPVVLICFFKAHALVASLPVFQHVYSVPATAVLALRQEDRAFFPVRMSAYMTYLLGLSSINRDPRACTSCEGEVAYRCRISSCTSGLCAPCFRNYPHAGRDSMCCQVCQNTVTVLARPFKVYLKSLDLSKLRRTSLTTRVLSGLVQICAGRMLLPSVHHAKEIVDVWQPSMGPDLLPPLQLQFSIVPISQHNTAILRLKAPMLKVQIPNSPAWHHTPAVASTGLQAHATNLDKAPQPPEKRPRIDPPLCSPPVVAASASPPPGAHPPATTTSAAAAAASATAAGIYWPAQPLPQLGSNPSPEDAAPALPAGAASGADGGSAAVSLATSGSGLPQHVGSPFGNVAKAEDAREEGVKLPAGSKGDKVPPPAPARARSLPPVLSGYDPGKRTPPADSQGPRQADKAPDEKADPDRCSEVAVKPPPSEGRLRRCRSLDALPASAPPPSHFSAPPRTVPLAGRELPRGNAPTHDLATCADATQDPATSADAKPSAFSANQADATATPANLNIDGKIVLNQLKDLGVSAHLHNEQHTLSQMIIMRNQALHRIATASAGSLMAKGEAALIGYLSNLYRNIAVLHAFSSSMREECTTTTAKVIEAEMGRVQAEESVTVMQARLHALEEELELTLTVAEARRAMLEHLIELEERKPKRGKLWTDTHV